MPASAIEEWISPPAFLRHAGVAAQLRADAARDANAARPLGRWFNAMVAPLAPYGLRGVLWYQGESNVARARQYAELFPAMIRDWRAWFERELPFAFVQLPGFAGYPPPRAIAELRDVQRRTLAVPDTSMVVTIDLSDGKDIHGADKTAVAARLAAAVLGRVYGRADVAVSGPLYRELAAVADGLQVRFDHADGGLVASRTPLAGFEFAGDDRRFHPAIATIDGDTVVVRSPDVPTPRAVRYGWQDIPEPTLRSATGLPAAPFRTDDWIKTPDPQTTMPPP